MIGVIADDITGAMDCGAQFAQAGLATRLTLDLDVREPVEAEVLVSGTREAGIDDAARAIHHLLPRLEGRRLFKKIDSTMRGPIGPELRAILVGAKIRTALVCPAIIEEGRTVRDGRLFVTGRPLDQTEFAAELTLPTATADLSTLLGGEVARISLDSVRKGPSSVSAEIRLDGPSIMVADACTQEDLDCLASAAIEADALPAGGFGLARSWVKALPLAHSAALRDSLLPKGKTVFLMGSFHPVTQGQVAALRKRYPASVLEARVDEDQPMKLLTDRAVRMLRSGDLVALHSPAERLTPESARAVLECIVSVCLRLCQEARVAAIWVSGGETAAMLCRALGTRSIEIRGELDPGLPVGVLQGGSSEGTVLVTKAGGFCREGVLVEAAARFHP